MGFDAFLGSGLYGSAAQSQGNTSFADDAFRVTDDGEVTAKIAFQASAISSGTTRTIFMPDADVDLGSLGGGGGGGGNAWSDPVSSNIVPNADVTYNIGSDANRFATAYVSSLSVVSSNLLASGIEMDKIGASTYSTVQHAQDIFHSTGQTTGGAIVSGSTTGVDVSAGTGLIRSGDDSTLPLNWFDWAASAGVSVPTNTTRYIGIEYNAGSPQITTRTSYDWNNEDDFALGVAVNEGGEIYIENTPFRVADHAGLMIERLYETMPLKRDQRIDVGLILGETGTRNISMTAGALWDKLNRFPIAAIDTSVSDTFDRYYRDGGGGWTKESAETQWDNAQYDDGTGTLASLAVNRWSTQYFYIATDGSLICLYGQSEYVSQALAEADNPPASTPDRLKEATLIGRLIFQAAASTADSIESAFGTVFAGAQVTDHGALAGLADDDHSQYLLTDGTRALTGDQDFGGLVADNYGPLSSTLSAVSTAEIAAGTETAYRVWSPADVSSAAFQHGKPANLILRLENQGGVVSHFQGVTTDKIVSDSWIRKVDLTNYRQARIRALTFSTAFAGLDVAVEYKTGDPTMTEGDYGQMADGPADIVIACGAATETFYESAWFDLITGAKAEVSITFMGKDIDSGATAQMRYYEVEFRA